MTQRNRISPTSSMADLDDFEAAFERSFGLVAFQMNRHLVDHMLRVGRELTDSDYEAMLIWGVLAHQNVAHLLPPGSHPCSVLNERGRVDAQRRKQPLRLRDLAQITRVPRETVRRKLEKLAAAGWIERQTEGWVVCSDRSAEALRDFSRDSVRRFIAAADEVMRTLREADAHIAAERLKSGGAPAATVSTPAAALAAKPALAECPRPAA